LNPLHIFTPNFVIIQFNITCNLHLGFPNYLFPWDFMTQILCKLLISPMYPACSSHIILDLIIPTIFSENRISVTVQCIFYSTLHPALSNIQNCTRHFIIKHPHIKFFS
jgi:hypothetical protein